MSTGIGWWIAHVTFWLLLGYGWAWDEIGPSGVILFVGAWLVGYFGLPFLAGGADLFFSFVAILDVVLVFAVFKGDVAITGRG
jgi:hypothetical protein